MTFQARSIVFENGRRPPPPLKKNSIVFAPRIDGVGGGCIFIITSIHFRVCNRKTWKVCWFYYYKGGGGLICYLPCRNLLPVLDIAWSDVFLLLELPLLSITKIYYLVRKYQEVASFVCLGFFFLENFELDLSRDLLFYIDWSYCTKVIALWLWNHDIFRTLPYYFYNLFEFSKLIVLKVNPRIHINANN